MLRLNAEQLDWLLAQQQERLSLVLGETLSRQWPALAQKLGERMPAFVEAAVQQAGRHGLVEPDHVARYVNLWCVWGPTFDDKPGFEWAAEVLADGRRDAPVKVAQLVMRSRDELVQRAAPGLTAEQFDAADGAMEAAAGHPRAAPWIERPGHAAAPRRVCDLSAFDLALGDQSWRQEYRLAWAGTTLLINRAPVVAEPQRYRTDTPPVPGTPVLPRDVAALAWPAARGHKAWLHVRCAADTVCDEATHPSLEIKSDAGGQTFTGRAARLLKLPLHAAEDLVLPRPPGSGAAPAAARPGAPVNTSVDEGGLCRERAPRHLHIIASTCGLRRAGAPLGTQETVLSVYPAEQWLAEFKTLPQPAWQWPHQGAREPAPAPLVRLERDGQALPVATWVQGWQRLGEALVTGVDGWFNALLREEVLLNPRLDFTPALMQGHAAWTWGAREACAAQGSSAFLRVQGLNRLLACGSDLVVRGELRHGGGAARVLLRSTGRAVLEADLLREQSEPALPALLSAVKTTWRHPFELELDALSSPELAMLGEGPASQPGALVGEAGLRPRPDGQGWQWFMQLRLEPCVLSLSLWDPVRGQHTLQRSLWPATTLLDWSVG